MTTAEKVSQMFFALAVFGFVFIGILILASFIKGRKGERFQALAFLGPAALLLLVGLVYPTILTIIQSFKDEQSENFVGFENYLEVFTNPDQLRVLLNTALWVFFVPPVATAIGLLFAILIDKARGEAFAKALIFLPMALSLVGASLIWKFMYQSRPSFLPQVGLFNEILVKLNFDSYDFLATSPANTFFLMIIMVWVQAGFAMTILSAAIKAVPDDIIEAARLDGVKGFGMFRHITLPSIRGSLVVVLTTLAIGVLKVFDIVRTMTNGDFKTSVVASEFVQKVSVERNNGVASTLAVILFVLVIPIIIYNVRQLRKSEG